MAPNLLIPEQILKKIAELSLSLEILKSYCPRKAGHNKRKVKNYLKFQVGTEMKAS
jgi:hypothetical protein